VNSDPQAISDLAWMRITAEAKPIPDWDGDLSDDCTARWAGFTLRAEYMKEGVWWWATYLDAPDIQIASSNDSNISPSSGEEARAAAVHAALSFLYPDELP
jgi:hypothetical protein